MLNKKAAMFGLDARIALAIFGALSVISGAAWYSAIQQSKVIAIVSDLNEIGKAYEAYILDTGANPSDNSVHSGHFDIADLVVDPSVSGWSGPYLSYSIATDKPVTAENEAFLNHNTYSFYRFQNIVI